MTRARRAKRVLFLLAHQDDEVFLSTRIARELHWGNEVQVVFLTDGRGRGSSASLRDAESRVVLASLGVPDASIAFLGSEHGIPDGGLVEHLARALELLESHLAGREVHRVYAPAWEGGHPDHDATHLVALAWAAPRGRLGRCWQAPLYHGEGTRGRLFRVGRLGPSVRGARVRRLPLPEAAVHTLLPLRYRSQRRTWMGLLPGLVLERLVLRREPLAPVCAAAVRERPHAGPLLYERLFSYSYPGFRWAAARFVADHLP